MSSLNESEQAPDLRQILRARPEIVPVVATAVFVLVGMQYLVRADRLYPLLRPLFNADTMPADLLSLCAWALGCVLLYLVVPVLVCRFLRRRPAELGLTVTGFRPHAHVYLLCFLPMIVLVLLASGRDDFLATYPFLGWPRNLRDLLIWEACYAAQFIALEFFFRGFLLHGLKHAFGEAGALTVTLFPYVMIHFGKPLPEVCASFFAGIILGALSLRTGGVLGGALLHIGVAWSMDLAALWREGWFAG